MRTASPWWASLAFGLGLLFVLVGERVIGDDSGFLHVLFSGLGLGAVVAVTAARAWAMFGSEGGRRKVERTLLVAHLLTWFGLFLYLLTTGWGPTWSAKSHAPTMLQILYAIVFVTSLVPVLMIELSLGIALRSNFDVGHGDSEFGAVEFFRVREIGMSGLSVGLALCLLMVTCKVATERNVSKDVSYFKTSQPGESTVRIVEQSTEPVKAMLFFKDAGEVHDQVRGYFDALKSAAGKFDVEEHDRVAESELATTFKVTKDGVIVLVRGTGDKAKGEIIEVDPDIDKARKGTKLRNLDREVNTHLLKLLHDKGKIYLLSGHGEFTNPDSMTAQSKAILGSSIIERGNTAFKKRIADLNYETKDIGLFDLSKDVPDDAAMVLVMAPMQAVDDAEWDALGRYLDRGGRLMIALDPKASPQLGSLGGKLGIKYNPGHLTDERNYLQVRHNITDRRYPMTTQFSSHASTTSLSRAKLGAGLILWDSGAIEDAPFTKTGALAEQPKKTYTIHSQDTSFLDYDDNFTFDPAGVIPEKKQRWNIAVAIEGPKLPQDKDGFRALVFADVDMFADLLRAHDLQGNTMAEMVSGDLLDDSIKWLAHDENIVGEVESEDDKPIQHTKGQDAAWFMVTIIGMPFLVFGLGMLGVSMRKKRRAKKEVTP